MGFWISAIFGIGIIVANVPAFSPKWSRFG